MLFARTTPSTRLTRAGKLLSDHMPRETPSVLTEIFPQISGDPSGRKCFSTSLTTARDKKLAAHLKIRFLRMQ
ncbi:hypothetical protein ABRZ24_17980 [Brenneria populi]|uniref:Transposase n=1 Tax=Brenneria populi TaxID=1505588 RepID=A0ABU6JV68_9GAMM|nr:hypothetical protein [Brenneria populi Li et al. 2015]